MSWRVAMPCHCFKRLKLRSTTLRRLQMLRSNAGGRPPRRPRLSRLRAWSAQSLPPVEVFASGILSQQPFPGLRKRGLSVDDVHEGQHPAVDLVGVIDLGSVAGVGDDLGSGAWNQAWNALDLPVRVARRLRLPSAR